MKTLLAAIGATAISLSPLIALEWNVRAALPGGQVTVMQIVEPDQVSKVARAAATESAPTARRL